MIHMCNMWENMYYEKRVEKPVWKMCGIHIWLPYTVINVQLPYTVINMKGSIHKLWCTTWELYGSHMGVVW